MVCPIRGEADNEVCPGRELIERLDDVANFAVLEKIDGMYCQEDFEACPVYQALPPNELAHYKALASAHSKIMRQHGG